ncbi:MAG: IS4 family transposase [Chloroflexi bacterium]|nr:MAG: IS4 family transposase [Chloroflexota bacterium]
MMRRSIAMMSVSQMEEALREILGPEANELAKKTGFIQRERKEGITGSNFAQTVVFGWLAKGNATLGQLTQMAQNCNLNITESGLSQRFTKEAAEFLRQILEKLTNYTMKAEAADIPLLKRFSAVILEDSTVVSLPPELEEVWEGCGGSTGTSKAALKMHVRWDIKSGELQGPQLTDGKVHDSKGPFQDTPVPGGALYVADLAYFFLARIKKWRKRDEEGKRRYVVTRLNTQCNLYTHSGHKLELRGLLPRQPGKVVELGVLVGKQDRLPARLIMICLSDEVTKKRQEKIEKEAKADGRTASPEQLELARWLLLLTTAPCRLLSFREIVVIVRLRWQIELLFKLWKEHGMIDEWGTKKPWRILCEIYGKMIAMIIQHWLLLWGCWHDPHRSLVKAAEIVRQSARRIIDALHANKQTKQMQQALLAIKQEMRSGCRLNPRKTHPNTSQLLLDGLDWHLTLT